MKQKNQSGDEGEELLQKWILPMRTEEGVFAIRREQKEPGGSQSVNVIGIKMFCGREEVGTGKRSN